jgi:Zn-dependent protease with chaperone function
MYFQNRANGYIEEISSPGLWTLLFGPIYFVTKGIWTHALAAFALIFVTAGISWLFYPFFARQIVQTHFLRRGWVPLSKDEVRQQVEKRRLSMR